jgi:pimeloyl-ACP methyl ester carboxylesterase
LNIVGTVAAAPAGDLVAFATAIRRQGAPDVDWLMGLQIVSVWHEIYGLPMDPVLSQDDQARAGRLAETCPDFALIPPQQPLLVDPTTIPEWREHLEANTPGATKAAAPILVLHGTADDIIPIETTQSEVQSLCRAGDTVEFRSIQGADHGDALYGDDRLAELVQWSTDRLDGDRATSTCGQYLRSASEDRSGRILERSQGAPTTLRATFWRGIGSSVVTRFSGELRQFLGIPATR